MSAVAFAWVVGVAAGAVAAAAVVSRAGTRIAAARASELSQSSRVASARPPNWRAPLRLALHQAQRFGLGPIGRVVRGIGRRRRSAREIDAIRGELPLAAELLAVAVGAGCTPFLAVEATAGWMPPHTARHLRDVLRSCELGVGFGEALRRLATSAPALESLADALATSERTGAPVGAALARTADEARATVRRASEARARTVPVRLLFPLVFLVLPAFGLLTVAPALLTAFART